MYAGIQSLSGDKQGENDLIVAMNSKEGESVNFKVPVNITEDARINIWLTKVDNAMTNSLASSLEQSLLEINAIPSG